MSIDDADPGHDRGWVGTRRRAAGAQGRRLRARPGPTRPRGCASPAGGGPGPQPAQVAEGVDAGGVPAGEGDLKGVLADQGHVRERLLLLGQPLHGRQPAGQARLSPALGAGAGPAQLRSGVSGAGTVLPGDLEHVLGSDQVDLGGEGVRVPQGRPPPQRTLMTGRRRKDWMEVRAATWEARSRKARAPGESGRETTMGAPASASTRICSSSGTPPRKGTPSRWAARSAPPCPKTWCSWPQLGQTNQLMFSTRPSGVTFSFRNIWRAFTAMSRAMSWGVATMTTPVRGTCWATVREASPVPGGRSMTR